MTTLDTPQTDVNPEIVPKNKKNPRILRWIIVSTVVIMAVIGSWAIWFSGLFPQFCQSTGSVHTITLKTNHLDAPESQACALFQENLMQKIQMLEQKMATLEKQSLSVDHTDKSSALSLVTWLILKDQIEKGQAFKDTLLLLTESHSNLPESHESLDVLKTYGALGVPSYQNLRHEYQKLRQAFLQQNVDSQNAMGFLENLKNMIKIQKKDLSQQDQDLETQLKAMDQALSQDAWEDLLRLSEILPKPSQDLKAFLSHLQARLEVDKAAANLQTILLKTFTLNHQE